MIVETDNRVPLGQQELSQVGAILTSDSGNKSHLLHVLIAYQVSSIGPNREVNSSPSIGPDSYCARRQANIEETVTVVREDHDQVTAVLGVRREVDSEWSTDRGAVLVLEDRAPARGRGNDGGGQAIGLVVLAGKRRFPVH